MPRALWKDVVLAESDTYESVEGNIYFPPNSIKAEYFKPNDHHTSCFWKGTASYYNLDVKGEVLQNAAWYYPEPKPKAKNIENYVAFWKGKGVTIEP